MCRTRHVSSSHAISRAACLTTAIAAALLAGSVQAAGFQIRENSAIGLGRAFAGTGAAPGDAAIMVANPAGLSLLDGYLFQADLSLIDLSVDFRGGGNDALGRPLGGSNGGNAGELAPVPAAYFSAPIGERMRLGLSLTAPFGLKTEYDDGWVGRYHALTSELTTIDLGLALSYEVSPQLSLGAGVIYQYADAELSNAVDFGAILASQNVPGFLPQSADGQAALTGDNFAWGWTLGALWRPSERVHLGLSYRSEIDHTLSGDARFTVPAPAAAVFAGLPGNLFTDTGGRADLSTPAIATVSGYFQLSDRVALSADVSRTFWDSFQDITVQFDNPAQPATVDEQHWRNTWFASLGVDYRLNERWTLRGGVAHDQTPTRLEWRTPRVPDTNRRWLSLGASYAPSDSWLVSAGYTRLFSNEPEVGLDSETGSTLAGNLKASTNLFAVSAAYRF